MNAISDRVDAPRLLALPRVCTRPGCPNLVREAWEETGTLCSRCALELELCDREARASSSFGGEVRRLHR